MSTRRTASRQRGDATQALLQQSTCLALNRDARDLPRQIAIPYHTPDFDEIFELAINAALIGQRVVTLCMRESVFRNWQHRVEQRAHPVPRLDLLDVYAAHPLDWAEFLSLHAYDLAIFHGIRTALESQTCSLAAAEQLVDAVPATLIVLA